MTTFKTIWGDMKVPDTDDLFSFEWRCKHCGHINLEDRLRNNSYRCNCAECEESVVIFET